MIARIACLLTLAILMFGAAAVHRVSPDQPNTTRAIDVGREFRHRSVEGTSPAAKTAASTAGRDENVEGPVDLYGNEVNAAVATYKLDGTGALYELHSPQTEVPQLAPPKS